MTYIMYPIEWTVEEGGYINRRKRMAIYLNTIKPIENYKRLINTKYFVDKSMIIEKFNELINTANKYICITRPRRFGKSAVADMLGTYYSKGCRSKRYI